MTRHLKHSLVGLTVLVTAVVVTNLAVSYRTPTVRSPIKVRWDTPQDIPDRYRLYLDGQLLSEFPPPGGPVGCRCQEVKIPATPGTHRIALRSVRRRPELPEMESTATEITVTVEP